MQYLRHERQFEAVFGFPERDYATTKRVFLSLCAFETSRGRERCILTLPPPPTRGQAAATPVQLSSGWHYTPSVEELRQEVRLALASFEGKHPGYLAKVRAHFSSHPPPRPADLAASTTPVPFTTVASLHLAHVLGVSSVQHLHYPGALFQAASQLNLLEFIGPKVVPEDGIDRYVFDATQGPDCAVACFAGTAYRNYLLHPDFVHDGELESYQSEVLKNSDAIRTKPRPPLSPEALNVKRGQRRDWQLDTLQDITRFLTGMHGGREGHADVPAVPFDAFYRIQSGHFLVSGDGINALPARVQQIADFLDTSSQALLDRLSDMLRIGVVEDATVTCGVLDCGDTGSGGNAVVAPALKTFAPQKPRPFVTASRSLHTVWQTYNSALSLSRERCDDASAISMMAKCVLNGSYEATLLVGVQRTLRYLDEVATQSGGATVGTALPPVFLTKVGGGAFRNKPAWISNAIERAMSRISELGVPLDLRLVHYRQFDRSYLPSH